MIHLERGGALSTAWTHYEFPLSSKSAHRWRDENGRGLTQSEFSDFLATDPAIYFRADFTSAAGEATDLDNVGIVPPTPRTLSLRFRKTRDEEFYGRLKSDNPECESNIEVGVFRKANGKRKLIGSPTTDAEGRYGLSDAGKPGTYFSRVGETELEPSGFCEAKKSNKVKLD